ncbi:hypothetical protein AV656_10680 [Bhargavaea cecembensis]|uniref:Uncharacterized protein n=1 Tax=Bhargavaea cecembensis TaxID=394098 RepID=A0A161RC16_9BACL|nr:hypothetical protein AV656_10680 [Bhargavaea cecembensis]
MSGLLESGSEKVGNRTLGIGFGFRNPRSDLRCRNRTQNVGFGLREWLMPGKPGDTVLLADFFISADSK